MSITKNLHDLGQSLWLDNITREILDNGTLRRYIDELSVTGLTSNPTIFDEAIGKTVGVRQRHSPEGAAPDCRARNCSSNWRSRTCAAPPICFGRSSTAPRGIDGWVSMEVSPLLANDTKTTIDAALRIHKQANRPNLYVKIPGHAGRRARHRGGDLRRRAGQRDPAVLARTISERRRGLHARHRAPHRRRPRSARELGCVAVRQPLGPGRRRQGAAGTAQSARHRDRGAHLPRALRIARRASAGAISRPPGARKQRMLWASTGTKDPKAPPGLYVEALAAPDTIDTMPEKTLLAFAASGNVKAVMAKDGGDAEAGAGALCRGRHRRRRARRPACRWKAPQSFVKSWTELMQRIADKSAALATILSPRINPLAGKPAPAASLVDIPRLITAYYSERPDPGDRRATSRLRHLRASRLLVRHRLQRSARARDQPGHLRVPQAARHRRAAVHRLRHARAVGAGVRQRARSAGRQRRRGHDLRRGDEYTPTPAVSHAILTYNRGRSSGLADGIVITPSHNPPDSGGFKYNPPNGGPADSDVTRWIETRANELLQSGAGGGQANRIRRGAARRHHPLARLPADLCARSRRHSRHGGDPRLEHSHGRRSAGRRRRALLGAHRRALRARSHAWSTMRSIPPFAS